MSFKVAIVCEDPTYDRYIIEPVVATACEQIGKPRAQIRTVTSPATKGVSQLKAAVCDFLRKWGGISDIVLFVLDADGEDGEDGRPDRRVQFENAIAACDSDACSGVVVARQEVEVIALWGCYQEIAATWDEIRSEVHPKERFFEPQLTDLDLKKADRGRRRMVDASLDKGWGTLTNACPELADLEAALAACL